MNRTLPLTNRRVVITGASRGIGREAALALARRGDRVVLVARDSALLEQVAVSCRALGAEAEVVRIDLTDEASVRAGAAEILARGPVDVLINNAGVSRQSTFLAQSAEENEHEMLVNYFGAQRMTRALLPAMLERRAGTIVNVSSLLGAVPCPTVANYSGTKAALNAWSHALRGELAGRGVRVVVFMPSHTKTEMGDASRFDGVYTLPVAYTVKQLLIAVDRAPRSMAASPIFRMFLRLAGAFPAWGEQRVAASTRALLTEA